MSQPSIARPGRRAPRVARRATGQRRGRGPARRRARPHQPAEQLEPTRAPDRPQPVVLITTRLKPLAPWTPRVPRSERRPMRTRRRAARPLRWHCWPVGLHS